MGKAKLIGFNFLEQHIGLQESLKLDDEHVIVDRDDWKEIVLLFRNKPELIKLLGEKEEIIISTIPKDTNLPEFVVVVGKYNNCWLIDDKIDGDPPRTVIFNDAKIFYSKRQAEKAVELALTTHPTTYRFYKIVQIKK